MTYPYFKLGLIENVDSIAAEAIPTEDRRELEIASAYRPHKDLSHAVNVALVLGMPLLVTGGPGTGKTQLAHVVAKALKCNLHKFETKSTSAARDLFYTFDALSSFKMKETGDQSQFIHYQALGRAILDAFPASDPKIKRLLPPPGTTDYVHTGPRRSVVLVDEIDKAPRDFPNDLLNEIDRLYFRVVELRNLGTPGADADEPPMDKRFRPIVIMTSNSEKGLPDPFLRRCVYFDIPFPDAAEMREIVASRIERLRPQNALLTEALDLFYRLRHKSARNDKGETNLKKEPSTAELLNWLQILLHRGVGPGDSLKARPDLVEETLTTLIKNPEDGLATRELIQRWAQAPTGNRG